MAILIICDIFKNFLRNKVFFGDKMVLRGMLFCEYSYIYMNRGNVEKRLQMHTRIHQTFAKKLILLL